MIQIGAKWLMKGPFFAVGQSWMDRTAGCQTKTNYPTNSQRNWKDKSNFGCWERKRSQSYSNQTKNWGDIFLPNYLADKLTDL